MRTLCLAFAALLAITAGHAATPDKGSLRPIWEWSDEERVTARMALLNSHKSDTKGHGHMGVDGATNPELFLPYELFDSLVIPLDKATDEERQRSKGYRSAAIRPYVEDEAAFWMKLERIVQPYLVAMHRLAEAQKSEVYGKSTERPPESLANCRARYGALQEARETIPNFDRLLYQAIAPGVSVSQSYTTRSEGEQLLSISRGCK
jgi:hypothetical protein